MLRGSHSLTMDTKGRIAMPTRYRDLLMEDCEGQMICTVDINSPCILLYPMNHWEAIEAKLLNLSDMNPIEARIKRIMLGNANELDMDKNGRLLIPPTLREHAKLEKQILLSGRVNKFEIWSDTQWQKQMADDMSMEMTPADMTEKVKNLSW